MQKTKTHQSCSLLQNKASFTECAKNTSKDSCASQNWKALFTAIGYKGVVAAH
jgi:hypothetical protein